MTVRAAVLVVATLSTGLADSPAGTPPNPSRSGRPAQRSASMPDAVRSTTPGSGPATIVASSLVVRPVARLVRVSVTCRPSVPSTSDAGDSSRASRFFSITPPGRPSITALTGTMPSATPSKRNVAGPRGNWTRRVSVTSANPPR